MELGGEMWVGCRHTIRCSDGAPRTTGTATLGGPDPVLAGGSPLVGTH
jgi:hypothetical protein